MKLLRDRELPGRQVTRTCPVHGTMIYTVFPATAHAASMADRYFRQDHYLCSVKGHKINRVQKRRV